MNPVTAFAVALKQVTVHNNGIMKVEWEMSSTASAALYVQVHDSTLIPTAGAVPKKSWLTSTSDIQYKEFKNGELRCGNGVFVGLSTTEGTYTAASAGGDIFNMLSVEVETLDFPLSTFFAGDLTSNVQFLSVWSDTLNNQRSLIGIEVDASAVATNQYLQLFANPSANDGDYCLQEWIIPALAVYTGASRLWFGKDGIRFTSQGTGTPNSSGIWTSVNTTHVGCLLIMSTTAKVLTTSSDDFKIKAEYK